MALALLAQRDSSVDVKRLSSHMTRATNATDELAGFMGLMHVPGAAREAALSRYYKRWKDDHLMIDHWFGGQATSRLKTALPDVKKLMTHPLFDVTNPNKVRSLVFPFAGANPVNFHRLDGKGYAFVADTVLKLDKINPQVAARLAGVFRTWRTLEPRRRALIKTELKRILATKPLSRDVFEIVSKTLN
jgi:aminopeptidase N